jgi:hypothetical protein
LAQAIRQSFDTLPNGNPKHYLDTLYSAYETRAEQGENNVDILEHPLEAIARFRDRLDGCAGTILQEVGIGGEWNRLVEIRKPILFMIRALEEMICEVLISENELLAAYCTSSLEFQRD